MSKLPAFLPDCEPCATRIYFRAALSPRRYTLLLRDNNRHLLRRDPPAAILPDHHNRMLASMQRLRKVPKGSVRSNIWDVLPVDDQRRARLRAPDDFCDAPVELCAVDLQQHLLRSALRDQRELVGIAHFTDLFLCANRDHLPEIISRIKPCYIRARARYSRFLHDLSEHIGRADAQHVR